MSKKKDSTWASKSDQKKSTNDRNMQLNCVLHFKDPKPSDESIKAKFTESDDTKVSAQIKGFKTGDPDANLIPLMSPITGLDNLYEMWENGYSSSRKLAQTMTRALDGQVKDDWLEIMSGQNNWANIDEKAQFVCLLKQPGTKTFGPKAYKQQYKVMENGSTKIPDSNLPKGTEQLFQISINSYLTLAFMLINILLRNSTKSLSTAFHSKSCANMRETRAAMTSKTRLIFWR